MIRSVGERVVVEKDLVGLVEEYLVRSGLSVHRLVSIKFPEDMLEKIDLVQSIILKRVMEVNPSLARFVTRSFVVKLAVYEFLVRLGLEK